MNDVNYTRLSQFVLSPIVTFASAFRVEINDTSTLGGEHMIIIGSPCVVDDNENNIFMVIRGHELIHIWLWCGNVISDDNESQKL